ncbi:MAG: aminotransferase class V-fold PLP-dependent enzyme [Candidatus Latescibacterota bacterium]|nr:aminotransferase class V-fold PLP-dependent enzyme [Candidatus Latescibacterota bacterium]
MSEGLIYCDNAATTFPKPIEVMAFATDWYGRYGVNPGRSGTDLAIEAEDLVRKTRERLTRFLGSSGDPDRLVFTQNASDSLNIAIQGVLSAGDHVITTDLDHNSVLRPIFHLTKFEGIESTYVPFDDSGRIDPEVCRKAIQPNTKAVVMTHGSNALGTVQPVADVGRICREHGILLVLDVAQTVGMIPIEMETLSVDVVCFTGHKSLMGPSGIGGLYVREGVDVAPLRYGGTGVRSEYPDHLDEYPWRLECGTLNLLGVAGLKAALDWIDAKGLEMIEAHEKNLTRRLLDGLGEIDAVTVYGDKRADDHLPVVSVNIDGMTANNVGTLLDVKFGIATRTGLQCAPRVHQALDTVSRKGTVRISFGPFNTEDHVDVLIKGFRDISSRHGY